MAILNPRNPRITDWLRAVGVEDVGLTQRIIIDVPVSGVVKVYVTFPADKKAFDIQFKAGEFQIVTIDKLEAGEVLMDTKKPGG